MNNSWAISSNKFLVIIFSSLCVIITGLIIAVVNLNIENSTEPIEETQVEKIESDESEEVDYYTYYTDSAVEVMNSDNDKTRSEEVIDYAKKADEIAQSQDSAVLLLNIALYYDLDDLYDEYNEILRNRQIAEGFDPDAGGEG